MNNLTQLSDVQLLQEAPLRLLEKYYRLIEKVVLAHLEKSAFGKLTYADLLKGVQERLPQHLQHLYQKQGRQVFFKTLLLESTRMLCHHVEDLHLLQAADSQLVLKYKPTICARIFAYVNTDQVRDDQSDDLIQYVSERLLQKFHSESFRYEEGTAMFRTYFYHVINNAIRDGLRGLRSKKASIGSGEILKESHSVDEKSFDMVSNKLDLEQQCKLYAQLLTLYKLPDRTKFELSAKVSYYLLLKNEDVQALNLSEDMKVELLVCFGVNYADKNKDEVWKTLVIFTNLLENKSIGADGLQKWFMRQRNWIVVKILYIMNFNGVLQKKLNKAERGILAKISDRTVGKIAEEYLGEIVYGYYSKGRNG